MKTPKSEPEYICDTSRMRQTPPHNRLHWLFALLLMTAIAGALWQHGNAGLTIGLLAATPFFAASVYLPYRWVNSLARAIFNCFVFCGAIGWMVWRTTKDGFPDLILVEGLCIASLIFMDGGRPKDYFYLFFISIFLLIYGTLVPRMMHLYLTGGAIVLLLILAFFSRTAALAGKPPVREIPSRWNRLWHPAVLQLFLSAVLFWYIFAMMPLKNNDAPGLFETSFLTTRETALPPEISQWLRPKKYQHRNNAPIAVTGKKPEKPTAADEKGTPANLPDPVSKSIIDGSGSSSQGQDLVFHVKSDVKLYHLARLYDQYDGAQWKASPRLERVRIRDYAVKAKVRSHLIEQKYSLVKMLSLRLYSGFRMSSLISENGNFMFAGKNLKTTFYGAELLESPSELPFEYKVSVQMMIPLSLPETHTAEPAASLPPEPKTKTKPKKKKARPVRKPLPPDPAWTENISRQHYLNLPRKKISKRVMDLASRLTAGNLTVYGKALALRDHLRNTYPYRLEAKPVPPGKEPADYFLFELKEGHCEYFACALAVLARAAGLPSRVAVGFSPGNYNTLSNMFEVYEYHAHAWTQIYIEQLGWLTMDATPPSAVSSRTLPAGLGQLRDPFDDEWRITPPELTEKTRQFLKADLLANYNKRDELSKIDSTLVEMVKAQEEITEKVKNKYEGTVKKIQKSKQSGTLFRLKLFWGRFFNCFRSMFSSLYDFFFSTWLVFLAGLLLLFFGYRFFRLCFIRRRWRSKAVRVRELRKLAEECSQTDPRQAILDIYTALRFSLELAGQERGTLELLDFAGRLAAVNRNLSESARVIFLLYYKAEYSSLTLTGADAARAIALYDSIRYESE